MKFIHPDHFAAYINICICVNVKAPCTVSGFNEIDNRGPRKNSNPECFEVYIINICFCVKVKAP